MSALRTLHILNKPPEHARHTLCLSSLGPEDGLLLTENGVLALSSGIKPARCFALAPDLNARGLTVSDNAVQVISYEDMVELTASADKVISW